MYEYKVEIKDKIYQYLYGLFRHNLEDFSCILGGAVQKRELEFDCSPDEWEKIQDFLNWDNPDKDKEILALMGSSLEYAMLTSDNASIYGTRLGTIFSNKIMYIDTNIIYYCIGINGEKFKSANEMLLQKCLEAKEEIRITKYTEQEFKNTLDYFIGEIKKYESPSLNRIGIKKYINRQDIYLFYLEWKKNKNRFNTPEYFKSYIEQEYLQWKKKYNVKVEKKEPYDPSDEKNKEQLEQYCEEIPYKGTINYDAINIYWVEAERQKEDIVNTFSNEKYFFISSHKSLKNWDENRNNNLPVIVLPEVWMTLLSKFISRGKDDYKCYINFINMKTPKDEKISNKDFYTIVKAIEEITDDINQQDYIIDTIVENNYDYLNLDSEYELDADEIYQKTAIEAKNILADKIDKLEKEVNSLDETIIEMKQKEKRINSDKDRELSNAVMDERRKNAIMYTKSRILIKRIMHFIGMIFPTLFIVWQMYDFFVSKNTDNLSWKIINEFVKGTPLYNQVNDIFIGVVHIILVVVISVWDKMLLNIFRNQETIRIYEEKKQKQYFKRLEKANK